MKNIKLYEESGFSEDAFKRFLVHNYPYFPKNTRYFQIGRIFDPPESASH